MQGTEKGLASVPLSNGSGIVRPVVLLVDDERRPREAAAALLRSLDCDVLTASSGGEAVAILRENLDSVSLVLLDVLMPGMDGVQTLVELRWLRPDLPVILSSGAPPNERVAGALELEAVRFLQKPYTKEDLALQIESLLAAS